MILTIIVIVLTRIKDDKICLGEEDCGYICTGIEGKVWPGVKTDGRIARVVLSPSSTNTLILLKWVDRASPSTGPDDVDGIDKCEGLIFGLFQEPIVYILQKHYHQHFHIHHTNFTQTIAACSSYGNIIATAVFLDQNTLKAIPFHA